MPEQGSASVSPLIGHDRVRLVVQAMLRAAALNWTDAMLEEASGVPARTIKSYRIEGKEPSLANWLSLACVLGGPGLNPLLAMIGWTGRALDEADELNLPELVAAILRDASTIAAAAADGRIDHTEKPRCREAADMIIATVMPLSSAGEAA